MNDCNCNREDLGENGCDRSASIVILEPTHQASDKCNKKSHFNHQTHDDSLRKITPRKFTEQVQKATKTRFPRLVDSIQRRSILRVSTFEENTFGEKQSNKSVTFQPKFKCNVCDFPCDSPTLFRQHLDSLHSRPPRNLHEIARQKDKIFHESLSLSPTGITKTAAQPKPTALIVSRTFKTPRARCSVCIREYASSYLKIHKLRAHRAAASNTSGTHPTTTICQGDASQSTATTKPVGPTTVSASKTTNELETFRDQSGQLVTSQKSSKLRKFKLPRRRCSICNTSFTQNYIKCHKRKIHPYIPNLSQNISHPVTPQIGTPASISNLNNDAIIVNQPPNTLKEIIVSTSNPKKTPIASSLAMRENICTILKQHMSPTMNGKENILTPNSTQIRSSTPNGGPQTGVLPKKPLFYTFNPKSFNVRSSLRRTSLNSENSRTPIKQEVLSETIINEELKSTATPCVGPNKLETSFKTSKHAALEMSQRSTSTGLEKAEGQKSLFNSNFETPKSKMKPDRFVTFRRNLH